MSFKNKVVEEFVSSFSQISEWSSSISLEVKFCHCLKELLLSSLCSEL